LQNDLAGLANAVSRRQRRSTKFQDSHAAGALPEDTICKIQVNAIYSIA